MALSLNAADSCKFLTVVINYNATMGCDNNAFESKTTL